LLTFPKAIFNQITVSPSNVIDLKGSLYGKRNINHLKQSSTAHWTLNKIISIIEAELPVAER
ncbi:hypothetical protein T4B_11345, partial [Trichinella pseudospiralis]